MADEQLKNPRRKKGAKFHPIDAPLSIPIGTITKKESCDSRWFYYIGHFRDDCVVIESHGDIIFLYKMGFFGKGNLSRSKPEYEVISDISQKAFSKSEKLRRLPPRERQIRQSKFREIRKERFKNHTEWCRLSNEASLEKPIETTSKPSVHEINKEENLPHTCNINASVGEERDSLFEPHNKRRREEMVDLNIEDIIELESNYPEFQLDDISEKSEDDTNEEDISKELATGSRDVDEVMRDVVRNYVNVESHPSGDKKQSKNPSFKGNKGKTKKDDPYKVYEHLQLSLEEAFFLSYGLGCLTVYDDHKKPLTSSEMWREFCAAKDNFIPSYTVYHYFRSKGWVPKSGIKYGTDFVVYKQGMPFYHSSYSVIVQTDNASSTVVGQCGPVSWAAIGSLNRVSEHAAKEVMICYVIVPSDMTKQELDSPNCITRLKVQEVVARRWIPEQSREPGTLKT